jgi:regulatory protein
VKAPTGSSGKRPARRPKVVDAAFLDATALRYLDRFDATVDKLRKRLLRAAEVELARGAEAPPPDVLVQWVEALLARYQESGVLSDQRYAQTMARSLRQRGASGRGIVHKLRAHGVAQTVVGELAQAVGRDRAQELQAARQLVKRRKLGAFRSGPPDPKHQRQDLARLARAGFDYSVASQALLFRLGDDLDAETHFEGDTEDAALEHSAMGRSALEHSALEHSTLDEPASNDED